MKESDGMVPDQDPLKNEIEANYDYLMRNLGKFMERESGRYAAIRHQKVLGFFDDPFEAVSAARAASGDGLYSVQQVTDGAVWLGTYANTAN